MFEIKGKYTTARIYTDVIDEVTVGQIQELTNQEFIKDLSVAIMPDTHAGKGCVIGTTITIKDKVVPNLVGVDIGCGMLTVELGKDDIDYEALDNFIRSDIPTGKEVNALIVDKKYSVEELYCYKHLEDKGYILRSLGSLGGGNHFIEIDVDEDNNKYLVIHTGSRNLGKQVCEYYQKEAFNYQKDKVYNPRVEGEKIIKEYKRLGREKEIESKLKEIYNLHVTPKMPKDLCYLEGELFDAYLHDMKITQEFASRNREIIATKIVKHLKKDYHKLNKFETVHNYINMDDMILRKGAVSAYEGEILLIPINMRDGSIIARGKSNKEYNYSAPHGAGRLLSRSEANELISLEDYKEAMKGIYTTSVNESTIDESPFAYKPLEAIVDNIKDTVEIIKIIKPVYNFKAS